MIVDLFSHKIHSSGDDWPDKLAELATIFGEFEGRLFNRAKFETRLESISPRASYIAREAGVGGRRDASKFRDEISAYPAYLGLYRFEQSGAGWVVRMSETAKRFLLCEAPDVGSFLRLQLPLFQFPNAMGAAFFGGTNQLRIQANASVRSLGFIRQGVHLAPVRLISMALKADSLARGVTPLEATVSYAEIMALCNLSQINRSALPAVESITRSLRAVRQGRIALPTSFEKCFHLLPHTEMFTAQNGRVGMRNTVNQADKAQLLKQFHAINSIEVEYDGFDRCSNRGELEAAIATGAWGRYFDAVQVLPASVVDALTRDKALDEAPARVQPSTKDDTQGGRQIATEVYPFRERVDQLPTVAPFNRQRELADPEATCIKMQRRNLTHKELIDKMNTWLRQLGAYPTENEHIDLYAKIPKDGSFIFEMKSGGGSILDQIRKGLSQLYEYRFRYKGVLAEPSISLCLVLPESPAAVPWITDYLVNDRGISICWFDDDGNLSWPSVCAEKLAVLSLQ